MRNLGESLRGSRAQAAGVSRDCVAFTGPFSCRSPIAETTIVTPNVCLPKDAAFSKKEGSETETDDSDRPDSKRGLWS